MHLWSFLIALWAAVVERVGLIHGLEAFHWALAGASWRASRARMSWYTCETRGNYWGSNSMMLNNLPCSPWIPIRPAAPCIPSAPSWSFKIIFTVLKIEKFYNLPVIPGGPCGPTGPCLPTPSCGTILNQFMSRIIKEFLPRHGLLFHLSRLAPLDNLALHGVLRVELM